MKAAAALVVLLLASPAAASLALAPPVGIPPLPAELSDADLMRLLAARLGLEPARLPVVSVAPGDTVPDAITRLAARADVPVGADALHEFASLDPRLAAPVLLLLVSVERSWDLYDQATLGLSEEEKVELVTLGRLHGDSHPRVVELGQQIDTQTLFESGLLLVHTVETLVLPQLEALAEAGVWPANPVADPVGVLRIGGTGNDVETLNRIVQLDARGDDTYLNNAGATTLLNFLFGQPGALMNTPVSFSLDLSGNDVYRMEARVPAQGGSVLGFGYMLDVQGDDTYYSLSGCQGGGLFALHHDKLGNDIRRAGSTCAGGAFAALFGMLRDDSGNDEYNVGAFSGGHASIETSIGLLWDRSGGDKYRLPEPDLAQYRYGWGDNGGHGWLVDEGPEVDFYEAADQPTAPHGCNDCRWNIGTGSGAVFSGPRGFGNDNAGGLAAVLFEQENLA